LKAARFYATWLPTLFVPGRGRRLEAPHLDERNRRHLAYAARTSQVLARRLLATMARHGPKLEQEQVLLGNFVDVGVELFVLAATLAYADHLVGERPDDRTPLELANLHACEARRRIDASFRAGRHNFNRAYDEVAALLMQGRLDWLAAGAADPIPPRYRDWVRNDYEHPASQPAPKRPMAA
jgi:hypothetical protein